MIRHEEIVSVKSRLYFSMQHIQSAALFAKRSGQIEKKYDGNFLQGLLPEYWADVTASIFAAVSFLEATINEFFADATKEFSEFPRNLGPDTKRLMADMWKKGIPRTARYTVPEKFDIALTLARKHAFDQGKPPAQDVKIVVQLRNFLIHYEPEWVSDDNISPLTESTEKKLGKSLRGKFQTSPLMGKNSPFFPNKCLSYGCARWAVESSLAYNDEFYRKLGASDPYEHIRKYILTI